MPHGISIAFCDPGGTLTHDFQNRNLTFYTTELRSQVIYHLVIYNLPFGHLPFTIYHLVIYHLPFFFGISIYRNLDISESRYFEIFQIFKFSNLQIFKSSNFQIFKFSNLHPSADGQIPNSQFLIIVSLLLFQSGRADRRGMTGRRQGMYRQRSAVLAMP